MNEEKLDKVIEILNVVQVSQARTEEIMAEHIRRTSLNEENLAMLRADFKPIQEHVTQVRAITKAAMWIIGILATMGTAVTGLFRYLQK